MVLAVALFLFLMAGAVSAANQTDVITNEADLDDSPLEEDLLAESSQSVMEDKAQIETNIKSNDTNVLNGEDFTVRLTDSDSKPLSGKSVQFNLSDVLTNSTTDGNGVAKLKVNVTPGKYSVNYLFSESGYAVCRNSTDILVISTSASQIKADSYVAYVGVVNTYEVTLTVGDLPLSNREVVFTLNGKKYASKTDENGKAALNITEEVGTYILDYYYAGESNINSTSGSVKIKVKKGMPTTFKKYDSQVYRDGKAGYFKVRLVDERGEPLKSKKVIFKFKGKKYVKRTNEKGIAKIKIKLRTGSYKVKVGFAKTSVYNKAVKKFTIRVKSTHATNNGMWLFGRDMKSVDFKKLKKYGFNQVFLNFKALELHGKSAVEKWIQTAKSYGIKVHLWMQVFYGSNNWQNPVKNGKINYNLINSKLKEVKKYAKIKGIAGVHFDYVRYPGNAYKSPNGVKAVSTFVKKASHVVHKTNKKLIASAAIMPEPSSLKYYYGQDIPTISKYLDVLLPMVYKGNYHAGTAWIKSVTNTLVKQSKKAKVWTGLQSYRSDANLNKIPAKELKDDANAAAAGGAYGIILFRFGLFNYINFKEV